MEDDAEKIGSDVRSIAPLLPAMGPAMRKVAIERLGSKLDAALRDGTLDTDTYAELRSVLAKGIEASMRRIDYGK